MSVPLQLPEPEVVGAEYGGKWIAWDEQNLRIVSSGDTYSEAKLAGEAAGIAEPVLEFVPPSDAGFVGTL